VNVELHDAEVRDAAALAEFYARQRAFLEPFDPVRDGSFYSLDGQRVRLRQRDAERRAGVGYAYTIVADGELAGTLNVSNVVRGPFRSANIGYAVARELNGRGIATAAVGLVCARAFGELGLHRLEAGTLLDNVGSQRVLRRNAFQTIGVSRRYLEIAGAFRDHVLFARTIEDGAPVEPARDAVRVREATLDDARPLAALVNDVALEPDVAVVVEGGVSARVERRTLRVLAADRLGVVLVAEGGAGVIGRLDLLRDRHPRARHLAEIGIAVAPAERRRRVGSALFAAALDWCRRHGVVRLEAQVAPANAGSLAFFRRLGFDDVGLRRGRFATPDGLCDVLLLARSVDAEL
jgi:ribosomal-protein-alanine N-acetyltransferase